MSTALHTAPGEPAPPPTGGATFRGLRPLIARIHFYAGLLVGPFLLVAAVTGLLYTLSPAIERWVHDDALHVPVTGPELPLSEQVAAAVATRPGLPVAEVRPSAEPGVTTRVSFDAGLPESYRRTVFVDPYTAEPQATLDTYAEWLPVRGVIDNLHRSLLLGPPGQVYSELAASWLAVLAASGLVVQLTRRVRARRERFLPRGGGSPRARLRSWHGAVGVWASVGLLFLAATGLTWSQFAGANVGALRSAMDWTTPAVATALPATSATDPAGNTPAPATAGTATPATADTAAPATTDTVAGTADRVLTAARADGLDGPVEIVPGDPGEAWSVQQTERSWPSQQDSVAVDPATGVITDRLAFDDWPLAAKLARWGIDAHMGLLFGTANLVALAALASAVIVLVVWGYRMWWLRRPVLPGGARGAAGPPGSRERPSPASVGVVALAAVLTGLLLPVLGVSLLLFLLLDAALSARRAAPAAVAGDEGSG
ncbi:PepSY-associated TM helix domain-containing protein [Pseudonocardia parietis]|uniref:Iron-regulated membrane protein n=1 Tax=Pseudonocardia parietis TaxID=570936 RepID=A0ABS4W2Q1_9PSEU|nr:PepSY domain-containing protein [Pseudonocardia parietis]MBP2370469.1 putative iron-regulated membrane protein [Pseudonocardia parietis]